QLRMLRTKAVDLPGYVVLDVARREEHRRHRQDALRPTRSERRQAIADGRAGEFEITGLERHPGQARAQAGGKRLELEDRLGIAAAMAAEHDTGDHSMSFCARRLTVRRPVAIALARCCSMPTASPTRCSSCCSAWRSTSCSARCAGCGVWCRIRSKSPV